MVDKIVLGTRVKRWLGVRAALMATLIVVAGLTSPALADAHQPTDPFGQGRREAATTTVSPLGVPGAHYPIYFDASGKWEVTYTWPGYATEHYLESFVVDPTRTSTLGYPVYKSIDCSLDTKTSQRGEIYAEFYVYPNGMIMSALRPGNGPTQSTGDMETMTGRAVNDTTVQPLVFAGPWLNATGPAGTFTMSRAAQELSCP